MKNLLLMFAIAALVACTSQPPGCTALPGGAHYCLQASTAAVPFSVRQQVSARFNDQRETLIADIENTAEGLTFVGLTPFGMTVFQVSYDNHTAKALRLPDARLSPELMLGMLQLALWPAEAVQRGLGSDATVEDSPGLRRILMGDAIMMELRHDDSAPPYQHMQIDWPGLNLKIEIRSLPEQGTP